MHTFENTRSNECARCGYQKAFMPCKTENCYNYYHLSCVEALGEQHKSFQHLKRGRCDFYCPKHIQDFKVEKYCGFCQTSNRDYNVQQIMGKLIGPYEGIHKKQFYVHTYCALWSPQVFKSGKQILGVSKELRRAGIIKCSICQKIGASHGCFMKYC